MYSGWNPSHSEANLTPRLREKTLRASDRQPNYLGQWFSNINVWKNPLESLLKHSFLGFIAKVPHLVGVDWGLRFYVFNNLPYDAAAAGWVGGRV